MNIESVIDALRELLVLIPAILVAITVHEYFQGYVSLKLGDITLIETDTLKFNPILFIDTIGFISFIIFGYGWSKNIPIDIRNFKKPILYNLYASLVGIFSNLLVALILILLIILYKPHPDGYIYNLFMYTIKINLNYFIISLFPIFPLTGGQIITSIWDKYSKTEFIGITFLLLFFIFGGAKSLDSLVINFINLMI